MYTAIISSIIYANKINVGFQFDIQSLKDLVKNNIVSVNRSLVYFTRSKDKKKGEKYVALKMSKDQLTSEIGISIEILEHAVFLSIQDKDIKFDIETKQAIKKLFIKVEKIIRKIGEHDSDFISFSSTLRARPKKEAMDYIKKNW